MSVTCDDFISIAEQILAAHESEVSWRVAASRAYYGAFHCCRDLVSRQSSIPVNTSLPSHERVYQAIADLSLSFLGAKELKKIAYRTQNVRDIRVKADYEVNGSFSRSQAEHAVTAAKSIHKLHVEFCARHNI